MAAGKRISPITGDIVLKVDKWTAGLKQAERDTKALQASLRPMTDLAMNAGKTMAAAGLAITGALTAAAKVAANYGDAIGEAAEKTGLTTQQLSKLRYAAEQNDSSFDGLATGLKFLSKNLVEAATGGKEQARVFNALGVETKTATGAIRPMNDVLLEVADVFATMPDGPEKAAVAMKVFGKSGADLIPVLNQGSAGIKKLGDEAERFGVVIDDASAAMGDEFNKALDRSKTAALGLAVSVGNVLLPAMTQIADKGNEAVVWAASMAREFPGVTKGAAALGLALTGGGGLLIGLGTLGTLAPKVAMGLQLIGGAAGIAKAGLIGLAIGGVALVEREFRKLNATGIQSDSFFETVRKGAVASTGPLYLARAAVISLRDAWDTFNNRSRHVDVALGDIGKRLAHNNPITQAAEAATQGLATATTGLDKETKSLIASLMKEGSEASKTKDAIAELKAQFQASLKPADDLEKTISALQASFGNAAVLKVYGEQIIEATAKQKSHGFQISANIALLNAMAMGARAVNRELELVRAGISDMLPRGQIDLIRADIPETLGETGNVMAELGRKSQAAGEQIRRTEDRVRQMARAGANAAQITEELGSEIEEARRNAERMGVTLGGTTAKIIQQTEATRRATEVGQSFAIAIRSAMDRTADAIADMVVRGRFEFSRLKDIAADTASSMLGSFLKGLISPLTDALEGLGRKAGAAIGNILFGGGTGQQGAAGSSSGGILGSLGGSIGGALGGVFSGGGQAAAAGGTAAASGGFLSFIGGIGGIASGAGVLIDQLSKIGGGRRAANQVSPLENAFVQQALSIVDSPNLSAVAKSGLFESLWADTRSQLNALTQSGGPNATVATQAITNLTDFVSQRRSDLAAWMPSVGANGMGGGAVTVNAPLTLQVNLNGSEITALQVRDVVAPELTTLLETGVRGIREKWAQLLNVQSPGTVAPVGI